MPSMAGLRANHESMVEKHYVLQCWRTKATKHINQHHRYLETSGESAIRSGLRCLHDLERGGGRIRIRLLRTRSLMPNRARKDDSFPDRSYMEPTHRL